MYLYENWAPLQRPASTLAKALRDGPLWSAFGIRIAVRPRMLLVATAIYSCAWAMVECLRDKKTRGRA